MVAKESASSSPGTRGAAQDVQLALFGGVALYLEKQYHPFRQFSACDIWQSCEQENVSSPWKDAWSQKPRRKWVRLAKGKSLACLWDGQVEFLNGNFRVNFLWMLVKQPLGNQGI